MNLKDLFLRDKRGFYTDGWIHSRISLNTEFIIKYKAIQDLYERVLYKKIGRTLER